MSKQENLQVAFLFKASAQVDISKWSEVKIDSRNINFMQKPLLDGCRFKKCHLDSHPSNKFDQEVWALMFFEGSEWEQTFFIAFKRIYDESALPTEKKHVRSTFDAARDAVKLAIGEEEGLGYPDIVCCTEPATSEADSQEQKPSGSCSLAISYLLRRTKSLYNVDYLPLTEKCSILVDGKGVSVYGYFGDNYERSIIAYALGVAYREAMNEAGIKLAECDRDVDRLRDLHYKATSFNARYFFRYPMKLSLTLLPKIWDELEERYGITERNREFLRQLDAAQRLLQSRRNEEEKERERRVNTRLTFFGVLISGLGLVQITPDKAFDFFV